MSAHYIVDIENPEQNLVKVTVKLEREASQQKVRVFIPSWSPGSYLMREYARHIRWITFTQENGEELFYTQTAKGTWEIDWEKSELKTPKTKFDVTYVIYLNELTVRTSHVNLSHAFLHGPSYLLGVLDREIKNPTIEFRFPPMWSKLSTGLKDISNERSTFIYSATDYDELVDCPVEIGCQETDGFVVLGKPHNLAFYGTTFPHHENLKSDIQKIVATTAGHFNNELPYESYLFLTHFAPKLRGGLEHLNSTALQFDGRKLANRKDYIGYLSLVAHEYFHLWNVKRIRPAELGPFDYLTENYTTMLWLAEGLTSFMDDLLVYRAGLCTIEEYLEQVKSNLDAYYNIPGKKFHSLEQSSFNAWVKLYRPDENSKNSSISYYLKGGLVFTVLHSLLLKNGKNIDDLLSGLWEHFKERPSRGISTHEVYDLITKIAGLETKNLFETMVETTNEIDFETCFSSMGFEIVWQDSKLPYLGIEWEFQGDRAFAKVVLLDTPAYQAGVNAGDEIIFLNGLRFQREDTTDLASIMEINKSYELIVSRMGKLERLELTTSGSPKFIKEIRVVDKAKAERSLHRKA
jgi:predicted metalloprotease with PDZ domain